MKKTIEKIVNEVFNKNVLEITKQTNCFNNEVYIVKLINKEIVIKFFNRDKKEKDIIKEKNIIKLLKEKNQDLIFPKILHFDLSKTLSSKGFIIMSKLEGNTLEDRFEKISNKEKVFESLGNIIGKINQYSYKYYGFLDENLLLKEKYNYLDWKEKQIKKVENYLEIIENNSFFSNDFKEKNIFLLQKSKIILKFELGPCLCHGDLSFSNIIIDENDEIKSLIDFEFVYSGAPIYDLFKSIKNFKKIYPFRNDLIRGYSKSKEIPKNWEELMWTYHWIEILKWLSEFKNMTWNNLNKDETINRRKLILKDSLRKIDEIFIYFR